MILPILIVVPALLLGLGLYALISRMNILPDMVDSGGGRPSSSRQRFGDYPEDSLWPVRQVQRIPQGVLIGLVVVMALWVVGWLVAFIVGLAMLAV